MGLKESKAFFSLGGVYKEEKGREEKERKREKKREFAPAGVKLG